MQAAPILVRVPAKNGRFVQEGPFFAEILTRSPTRNTARCDATDSEGSRAGAPCASNLQRRLESTTKGVVHRCVKRCRLAFDARQDAMPSGHELTSCSEVGRSVLSRAMLDRLARIGRATSTTFGELCPKLAKIGPLRAEVGSSSGLARLRPTWVSNNMLGLNSAGRCMEFCPKSP